MREELEQKLLDRFPFYEARSMRTGDKLKVPTGAECGDGWYNTLYELCEDIEKELKKYKGFDFYFSQIKEKYGTLSVYVSPIPSDSKIYDCINKAEESSSNICEYCGSVENVKLNTSGWWRTICKECNSKTGGTI